MPRFNSSAHFARNSYYDLDPQGEWEAKNSERQASLYAIESVDVAEPKVSVDREEYDVQEDLFQPGEVASEVDSDDLGISRETSELLDRVASVNPNAIFFDVTKSRKPMEPKGQSKCLDHKGSFTQNIFHFDESLFDALGDLDLGDTSSQISQTPTTPNRDRQMIPPTPDAVASVVRPWSSDVDSAVLQTSTVEETTTTSSRTWSPNTANNAVSPKPTKKSGSKPASPVPGYSGGSPRGAASPSQRSSATPSPRSLATPSPIAFPRVEADVEHRKTSTPSPTPDVVSLHPGSKQKLIMSLDDHDTLQPIKTKDEVNRILVEVDGEQLPPPHPNVAEAVGKFKRFPINEISHYSTIGQYFGVLRDKGKCTDVNIRMGSYEFSAHRIAIACFSDYFADMFFRKNDQKQSVPVNIQLKGIDPRAFQCFLDFVYTGKIRITPDIIGDLHILAERLIIPKLNMKCAEFIDNMPLEYALSLLQSTLTPEYDLYQCAVELVCEQFARASKTRGFLGLDVETVCYILSQNQLTITSEREVFIAGLNWIAHAFNQRKGYIEKVMECVRFPYLTQEELFGCMQLTDLLTHNEKCRQMILKANWIISARNMRVDDPMDFQVQGPRLCVSLQNRRKSEVFFSAHSFQESDINVSIEHEDTLSGGSTPLLDTKPKADDILAVGEFNENLKAKKIKPTQFSERYVTSENKWKHHTNLPEPRSHYGAATLSGKLYVTGGYNPEKIKKKTPIPTKETYVLDTETNEWKHIAQMNTARMYHSLCSIYGMIYAIGGQDEKKKILRSVECYNPISDNWFYVKEMPTARLGTGVAVKDGKIFVAGGYGDTMDKKSGMPILANVESYSPRTNTWEKLNDLRLPRCYASMVAVDGQMYICGGATRSYTNKDSILTSIPYIDAYNEEYDTWEHHTDMAIARHNAGTTVIGGKIYLIGGISTTSNTMLNSIECFDVKKNEWINGVQALPYPGEWLQCVAIQSQK